VPSAELERRIHLLEMRLREARRPPRPFQWRTYGPREGLASNEVYQLLEAPDGTLYAGGIHGLHRFDGYVWSAVAGVSTRCHGLLLERDSGVLWAGFEGGLFRLDPGAKRLKPERFGPGVRPFRTPAPGLDAAGRLWVSSAEGLFVRGPDRRFALEPTPSIESLAYATPTYATRDGRLLLGTESGLYERIEGDPPAWTLVPGGPRDRVLDLVEDEAGALYVATAHGLHTWESDGVWRVMGEAEGLPNESCSSLHAEAGRVWIGTWGGLCVLERAELRCYDRKDGLGAAQVRDVLVDRRGLVWAGTRGGGVSVLNPTLWSRFSEEVGVPSQVVYSHHMDPDGTVWFEAGKDGLVRVGPDGRSERVPVPGVVRSVSRDLQGRLWAGRQETNPVYQESGAWHELPGRAARGAYFLVAGPEPDTMWIGTYWNGLFRHRAGTLTHWSPEQLGHGFVRMLHLDRDGALFIATLNGDLWRMPPGGERLEAWALAAKLPSTRVQAMAESADGSLWLGTDRGAVQVKDGRLRVFTEREGLADRDVRAIHEDRIGRLWLGTAKGLSLYDGATWMTLGQADGTPGELVTGIVETPAGGIWLTGSEGVSCLRPGAGAVPETFVEAETRGRSGAGRSLTHAKLRPMVHAQTRWWSHPARLFRFAWRLDSGPWSPFVRADEIVLEELERGPHRLEVRAKGPFLEIDATPAVLNFQVRPPVPREVYYAAVLGVGLLGAGVGRALWKRRGRYVGPYRLLRPLGEGSMGQIWKARDMTSGRTVAVKVLHPELNRFEEVLERFRWEAGSAVRVEHPNVMQILDRGVHGGQAYLTMELVEGWTLAVERRRRGGRLLPADALEIAVVLLEAVEALHRRDLLHLDLKPENVLLLRHGGSWRERLRVLDFGLGELVRVHQQLGPLRSRSGISYMAPEQALGRSLDARADVFSAAAILYELLSGQTPFEASNDLAVLQKMLGSAPPPLTGLPSGLEPVLFKALALSPRQRYASAAEMREALEPIRAALPDGGAAGLPALTPKRTDAVQQSGDLWTASLLSGTVSGLRRRLRILYELIEALLQPDLGAILERLLERVVELFGAERAFIFLRNENGSLELRVARGGGDVERARAVVLRVIASGAPVYLVDPHELEEIDGEPLLSILCVPFLHGEEASGALYMDSAVAFGSRFTWEEGHLLASLSTLAATAIASARQRELRRKLEDQLQQAQKMETIGTLAGGVAHDFNNLLAGMIGTLSMLDWQLDAEEASASAVIREQLEVVRDCALRAAEIVQQLLGLSRRAELRLTTVDLGQVVGDVVKICRASFDPRIEIEIQPSDEALLVDADPVRIKQVLLNLALNARDAMPDGGQLGFELRLIAPRSGGGRVRVTVRDTGHGIEPQHLGRIFDPFFTTKPVGKGTGLGLAMVYGIVTQHRGSVQVESERGKGTAFHVELPASTRAALPGAVPLSELPRGSETVLVVDDEQVVRQLARGMLQSLGYAVLSAGDGEEALDILRASLASDKDWLPEQTPPRYPPIDLVLLDLIMPKKSGRETLQQIRIRCPGLPVIVSSGVQLDVQSLGMRGLRVSGLLSKPYELTDLAIAVRLALDAAGSKEVR
jgi:signal transduction histidine kinase/ligand-binding sensor domain-containing protein/FixJ family two-component response regulator